jgi:peptide/nickel transport system permease protein
VSTIAAAHETLPYAPMHPARRFARRFLRSTSSRIALALVLLVTISAIFAPLLAPFPQDAANTSHLDRRLLGPGGAYLLGTDNLGRDVLSRLLFGGRTSLFLGFASTLVAAGIGALLGLVAGYLGRWVDELIMRIADIFLGVPPLILAVLVALTLGGGEQMTVLAIAATTWPRFARLLRGEVLRIKVLEFIEAAVSYGAKPSLIVRRHIFPATVPALLAQSSLFVGQGILVAATLGFIGLGSRPPSPEWGLAIAIGREYLPEAWWVSLFPGVMIFVTVTSMNLIGDAVRRALDARTDV